MIIDNYNIRLGMAYARELIESSPANISAQPIIENLQRSLVNKPLAQRVGIMIVIGRLRENGLMAKFAPLLNSDGDVTV